MPKRKRPPGPWYGVEEVEEVIEAMSKRVYAMVKGRLRQHVAGISGRLRFEQVIKALDEERDSLFGTEYLYPTTPTGSELVSDGADVVDEEEGGSGEN